MIIINADRLQDGLYQIQDGHIHKYKANGGTVRTYEMGEIVQCKDCLMTLERDEYTGKVWCCRHREYMDDMYYCADGLRRENGEE